MERVTSKTLDCFVEFENFNEAVNSVNYFEKRRLDGHAPRLGTRHVEIELSSQDQLMKALFPKAKNVEWNGAQAIILPTDPKDPYNSGFQGFVSSEELVLLTKHVESPQRSPFSKDCPQRPFECLLDTLQKVGFATPYSVRSLTISSFLGTWCNISPSMMCVTFMSLLVDFSRFFASESRRRGMKPTSPRC